MRDEAGRSQKVLTSLRPCGLLRPLLAQLPPSKAALGFVSPHLCVSVSQTTPHFGADQ